MSFGADDPEMAERVRALHALGVVPALTEEDHAMIRKMVDLPEPAEPERPSMARGAAAFLLLAALVLLVLAAGLFVAGFLLRAFLDGWGAG